MHIFPKSYFMRALMYFYLVRNFKEVPLVTTPYEDDSTPFSIAKSSEEEILKQIKTDVQTFLTLEVRRNFMIMIIGMLPKDGLLNGLCMH